MNNLKFRKKNLLLMKMYMEEYNICDFYDIFHEYQEYQKNK